MRSQPWQYDDTSGVLELVVHVQPNARRTEIAGVHGDALKIRLAAPAVDNKANALLVSYLAEVLAVPRSAVVLEKGAHARHKRIIVHAPSEAARRLEALAGNALHPR